MRLNQDTIIARLAELILAEHPDPIAQLQEEVHEARQEAEARAKQAANENPYRYTLSGQFGEVTYVGIANFSKHYGLEPDVVQAVLENRAKEVVTKDGRVLRAFPYTWVEHAERDKIQAQMRQEDEEEERHMQAYLARKKRKDPPMLTSKMLGLPQ